MNTGAKLVQYVCVNTIQKTSHALLYSWTSKLS